MEEKRDVTARVRITIKEKGTEFIVTTKNVFYLYEEIHILSKAQTFFAIDKDLFDEYENIFFEGSDPTICLAYNLETEDLRVSLNDLLENQVLGFLEQAKHIIMKDLMGE